MTDIFDLTRAVNDAWRRVNGLANLYEDKGNTLRPDGTFPSSTEMEPLRAQMLQAVEEAESLDSQLKAAYQEAQLHRLFQQPDAHLEAAYEDRVSGGED